MFILSRIGKNVPDRHHYATTKKWLKALYSIAASMSFIICLAVYVVSKYSERPRTPTYYADRAKNEFSEFIILFNRFSTDAGKLEYVKAYFERSFSVRGDMEYCGLTPSSRDSSLGCLVLTRFGDKKKCFIFFGGATPYSRQGHLFSGDYFLTVNGMEPITRVNNFDKTERQMMEEIAKLVGGENLPFISNRHSDGADFNK